MGIRTFTSILSIALVLIVTRAQAFDDHLISGEILQKLDSGILVSGKLDADGRVNRSPESGIFYVKDCPGKIYDGLKVNLRVSDSGETYSYIDVRGARRTVRAFVFSSFPPGESL